MLAKIKKFWCLFTLCAAKKHIIKMARFHGQGGRQYSLATLVEMLRHPSSQPSKKQQTSRTNAKSGQVLGMTASGDDGVVLASEGVTDTEARGGRMLNLVPVPFDPLELCLEHLQARVRGSSSDVSDRDTRRLSPIPSPLSSATGRGDDNGDNDGGEGEDHEGRMMVEVEPVMIPLNDAYLPKASASGKGKAREVVMDMRLSSTPSENQEPPPAFLLDPSLLKLPLPEVLDFRPHLLPVRDQGADGTCAAHVGACMREYHERGLHKTMMIHPDSVPSGSHQPQKVSYTYCGYFSPQFVYNLRPHPESGGMHARHLLAVLEKRGIVTEVDFPHGTDTKITPELLAEAARRKMVAAACVKTVEGAKRALQQNGVLLMSIPVYDTQCPTPWKASVDRHKVLGGHAVSVVGYNAEGFIIRNSWGPKWSNGGYTIFAYEDWGMQWEVYAVVEWMSLPPSSPPSGLARASASASGFTSACNAGTRSVPMHPTCPPPLPASLTPVEVAGPMISGTQDGLPASTSAGSASAPTPTHSKKGGIFKRYRVHWRFRGRSVDSS